MPHNQIWLRSAENVAVHKEQRNWHMSRHIRLHVSEWESRTVCF